MQCEEAIKCDHLVSDDVEIREIDQPDWQLVAKFWDGQPSWQNSIDAQTRTTRIKRKLGAFIEGECVGYIIFSNSFGRLAQIAVAHEHRNRGIGSMLLRRMQSETADGYSVQVINIDKSLKDVMRFFQNRGFRERISQYEMVKQL